jgi:hypothetical protein
VKLIAVDKTREFYLDSSVESWSAGKEYRTLNNILATGTAIAGIRVDASDLRQGNRRANGERRRRNQNCVQRVTN